MANQPEKKTTQPQPIKLRPAQKKRIDELGRIMQRAKDDLDGFIGYVVEDLEVPDGWMLRDLESGFVPPKPQEPGTDEFLDAVTQ